MRRPTPRPQLATAGASSTLRALGLTPLATHRGRGNPWQTSHEQDEQPSKPPPAAAKLMCFAKAGMLFTSTGRVRVCCARQGHHTALLIHSNHPSPSQSAERCPRKYALVARVLGPCMRAFPGLVADRGRGSHAVTVHYRPQAVDLNHLSRNESICSRGPSTPAVLRCPCPSRALAHLRRRVSCDSCPGPSEPVFRTRPADRPAPCCRQPLVNALRPLSRPTGLTGRRKRTSHNAEGVGSFPFAMPDRRVLCCFGDPCPARLGWSPPLQHCQLLKSSQ